VTATLSTLLSIAGLALDFIGAAFLAYDALYGAEARQQAALRRARLQIARENQETQARGIRELSEALHPPEAKVRLLREQVPALTGAIDQLVAEVRHWEQHEQRVQRNALVGLLLLMAGFACQGLASVMTMTFTLMPSQP
jgi:hypothetical protein